MSGDSGKSARELLATPVQFIKGVGPQRAELLDRMGLRTASDLLFYFPRDYYDASQLVAVHQLVENEPASVCGIVQEVDLRNTGPGRSWLGVLVRQDAGYLRAMWFNQPWMRDRVSVGARVLLSGAPRFNGGRWEMVHPRVEVLDDEQQSPTGKIQPIYSLTEGIRQWQMRRIVQGVAAEYGDCVNEVFPESYLQAHDLRPMSSALQEIHAPPDADTLAQARRRFVYQELLVLQLALAMRRQQLTDRGNSASLSATAQIDARIRRLFPFELTGAQDQAIAEISADMARSTPMNRLLQGDVGSGKTVVAEYAMLCAVAHGHQAAIMTPTEVLARQHVRTLARDLRESRVRIALFTGSMGAAERRETLERIAVGDVDLIIGTHALLHEEVVPAKLGLVVIDEQHKFGVRQRAALRGAGPDPHYLVMTATPIPRTVSMALFGDLDVSTLREAPPGRAVVHTYLGEDERREKWWDFFRKKLREGRQGYVIAPLVESGHDDGTASVQQLYEALANGELEAFRLDLIHGRMSSWDKEAAMASFGRAETQVLVATSVVEVGIDVPNATVMTIEGAERFGLAQLHQLRGRISRGTHPGYLCVFAETKTDEARQRLDAFCNTNDGFELAEIDFKLRGPGDLFGAQQHGLPAFRIADLVRDAELLTAARKDARELVAENPGLAAPEFTLLRDMVIRRYGRTLELVDVG